MSDHILSRRKFFGLFGSAVYIAIIDPKITYFFSPTSGWDGIDYLAICKQSFYMRSIVSDDENISMNEADLKLSSGLYMPTKTQIKKYNEFKSYFKPIIIS